MAVGVSVAVRVAVAVGVNVLVAVSVKVTVADGVIVRVGVKVGVNVCVEVGVGDANQLPTTTGRIKKPVQKQSVARRVASAINHALSEPGEAGFF